MKVFCVASVFFAVTVSAALSGDTNGLPSTITVGKDTYEEVRWGDVTPATVTIFHKSGIARIPLKSLPPELQKRLGYDPEKRQAEAAKAKADAEAEIAKARQAKIEAAKAVVAKVIEEKRKRTQLDPVAELKETLTIFAALNETTDQSYDVSKTDSLVSPYTGTVGYRKRQGGNPDVVRNCRALADAWRTPRTKWNSKTSVGT